jgi:hypothetical protein
MKIAVRTNLCHKRLVIRHQRRGRSVVIAGVVLLLAGAASFSAITWRELDKMRTACAEAEAEQARLEQSLGPKREWAERRAREVARRDPVLALATRRWAWAPVLERIFSAVPANTELSALRIRAGDCRIVELQGRSAGTQARIESDKCRIQVASALSESGYKVVSEFTKLEDSHSAIRFEENDYPVAEFVIRLTLN